MFVSTARRIIIDRREGVNPEPRVDRPTVGIGNLGDDSHMDTPRCFFASDLHGSPARYAALFAAIREERPSALFLGGDLLPSFFAPLDKNSDAPERFVEDFLAPGFEKIHSALGDLAPRVFLILGNDDSQAEEGAIIDGATKGSWEYVHARRANFGPHGVYGYNCVPPTPFQLKDWERYDVSRYVDPGCVSPEEGWHTEPARKRNLRFQTIQKDLEQITGVDDLAGAILLTHSPPYQTLLDRAALDEKKVDHVPLDVHVGSIAIRRLIEDRQPLATLHGHVHESARLTGSWHDRIGRTHCFSAAHDGPELALIRFDLEDLETADRRLITPS
jgi:Icc-related predicted phosphoesterase